MPKKVLLDWNKPLIPAITQGLLAQASGEYVDLSRTLVIVPTVQSGRRLREALALALAAQNRGLFPPEIATPDVLLAKAIRDEPVASEEAMLAAWAIVLGRIDPKHFQAVFPVEPLRGTGWQIGMAQRLIRLRKELGEEGLDFTEAAERLAGSPLEPLRWQQLARLESLYLEELGTRELKDPQRTRRVAAEAFAVPEHIHRIVLAATPDPQALPIRALAHAAQHAPLEVWIYGPNEADTLFDEWGRPVTQAWLERPMPLEERSCRIHTYANPKTTARHIAEQMWNKVPESVAIGLADPELNPVVADALTSAQIPCFDPAGMPIHFSETGRLTDLLCAFAESTEIAHIRTLLQHPDIWNWLKTGLPERSRQHELLAQLDRIFEEHLAPDLPALLHFSRPKERYLKLRQSLETLEALGKTLTRSKDFPAALAQALQAIYANKTIETGGEASAPWRERAEAIRKCIERAAETAEAYAQLPPDFARSALRHSLKNTRIHPERPREAHDLLGWLELLWNDAPHLILAGLNDGMVPESVVGDTFLPESLRKELGLRTNTQRFARDAYLLEALCRRRIRDGQIDILIPQSATDNTPLKPSRLLFLGKADTLLPRTRRLFHEPGQAPAGATHDLPWQLSPPPGLPLPARLSVSSLKAYLQCPFRFFLRHILGMRPVDTETRELSPAAFGNLFHDTASTLKGNRISATTQPADLIRKLHEVAGHVRRNRYGDRLSFALRLQEVALLTRIEAFCTTQVEDAQNNGSIEILDTERSFEIEIEGFTVTGRIDRIDSRTDGRLALIDYKTSDTPTPPEKAHLAAVGRKAPPAHLPREAFFEHNGKTYRWTDLQLPLYVLATREPGAERPEVAYYNLPKTLDKTGIERWEDFSESHLDSARACAAAVLRQIRAGIFWPPNPDAATTYDDIAPLFPDGIEHSVAPSRFSNYGFEQAKD